MTERDQFTFYGSFYRAMRRIRKKAARADVYDMLVRYALFQEEPDLEKMAPEATIVYELAKPNLDASRKKAINGSTVKSKTESKQNQTEIKTESNWNQNKIKRESKQNQTGNEKEKENEIENEIEKEDECQAAFEAFWTAYPKKIKKREAMAAFCEVTENIRVLLAALERQKGSAQWQEEGGRFIPNPATWLIGRRWEDELPAASRKVPMGCTGLKDRELADMEHMLEG